MYVPEFWVGVGATVLVELIALMAYSIYLSFKNKK